MRVSTKRTLIKTLVALAVFGLGFVGVFSVVSAEESAEKKTLVYSGSSLKWDSKTKLTKDGSVILKLFDTKYGDSIISSNGEKIVAPGASGKDSVTLKNASDKDIIYTAYAYKTYTETSIPVEISFAPDLKETDTFPLPEGVEKSAVSRAVTGTLEKGKSLDFSISWEWPFEDTSFLETLKEKTESLGVGLYFEVEDKGTTILPVTGDINSPWTTFALCIFAAVLLIVFAVRYLRKEQE